MSEEALLINDPNSNDTTNENEPLIKKKIEDVGNNSQIFTLFLIFKAYVGAGIMSMPYAFYYGTFILSNVGVIFVAILSLYCIHLLMLVHEKMPKVTELEEIGLISCGGPESKLGRFVHRMIKVIVTYTQLGFSIAYVIFISQNTCSMTQIGWRWWILAFSPFYLLLALIKKLRMLGPFAIFGFSAIFISCITIIVYCFTNQYENFMKNASAANLLNVDLTGFPILFGIVVYAFEGIGVLIPMKKAMKEPQKFFSTMTLAYIIMAILFCVFSSIAMLAFAPDVHQMIVGNLPENTLQWLSMLIKISICVALCFTYPVQMFPVFEIFENALLNAQSKHLEMQRNLLRLVFVIITLIIAATVPHFALFISLIGNLGSSLLMFVLPALFHLVMFRKSTHVGWIVLHVGIILFGVAATIIGTTTTINDIVIAMQSGTNANELCS